MLGAESFENSAAAARRGPPSPAGKKISKSDRGRDRFGGRRSYRHLQTCALRVSVRPFVVSSQREFHGLENWMMAVTGLCLLNACSGEDPGQPDPAGSTGGAAGSGVNGGAGGGAGTQSSGGTSSVGTGGGGGGPMGSGGTGGPMGAGGGPMGAGGGPMGAGGGPMGAGGGPGGFDYEAQTVRLDETW